MLLLYPKALSLIVGLLFDVPPPHFPLQVHQFSNKQTEMALRVASLDYLGTVASRLRKDSLSSKMDQRTIDRILKEVD